MPDLSILSNSKKNEVLNSAPDIWDSIKKSAAKQIAKQLINDLNGIPSNCGKLVCEKVYNIPIIRKVA